MGLLSAIGNIARNAVEDVPQLVSGLDALTKQVIKDPGSAFSLPEQMVEGVAHAYSPSNLGDTLYNDPLLSAMDLGGAAIAARRLSPNIRGAMDAIRPHGQAKVYDPLVNKLDEPVRQRFGTPNQRYADEWPDFAQEFVEEYRQPQLLARNTPERAVEAFDAQPIWGQEGSSGDFYGDMPNGSPDLARAFADDLAPPAQLGRYEFGNEPPIHSWADGNHRMYSALNEAPNDPVRFYVPHLREWLHNFRQGGWKSHLQRDLHLGDETGAITPRAEPGSPEYAVSKQRLQELMEKPLMERTGAETREISRLIKAGTPVPPAFNTMMKMVSNFTKQRAKDPKSALYAAIAVYGADTIYDLFTGEADATDILGSLAAAAAIPVSRQRQIQARGGGGAAGSPATPVPDGREWIPEQMAEAAAPGPGLRAERMSELDDLIAQVEEAAYGNPLPEWQQPRRAEEIQGITDLEPWNDPDVSAVMSETPWGGETVTDWDAPPETGPIFSHPVEEVRYVDFADSQRTLSNEWGDPESFLDDTPIEILNDEGYWEPQGPLRDWEHARPIENRSDEFPGFEEYDGIEMSEIPTGVDYNWSTQPFPNREGSYVRPFVQEFAERNHGPNNYWDSETGYAEPTSNPYGGPPTLADDRYFFTGGDDPSMGRFDPEVYQLTNENPWDVYNQDFLEAPFAQHNSILEWVRSIDPGLAAQVIAGGVGLYGAVQMLVGDEEAGAMFAAAGLVPFARRGAIPDELAAARSQRLGTPGSIPEDLSNLEKVKDFTASELSGITHGKSLWRDPETGIEYLTKPNQGDLGAAKAEVASLIHDLANPGSTPPVSYAAPSELPINSVRGGGSIQPYLPDATDLGIQNLSVEQVNQMLEAAPAHFLINNPDVANSGNWMVRGNDSVVPIDMDLSMRPSADTFSVRFPPGQPRHIANVGAGFLPARWLTHLDEAAMQGIDPGRMQAAAERLAAVDPQMLEEFIYKKLHEEVPYQFQSYLSRGSMSAPDELARQMARDVVEQLPYLPETMQTIMRNHVTGDLRRRFGATGAATPETMLGGLAAMLAMGYGLQEIFGE